ncbi:alpha/beta hydrolase family protein [Shewanella violacea]|uniref:DUF3530 family protein n=1 Tax=Shewanella violacea (strain JCM 10179 / CIP 106290 / LMG 19151 / DSS12) TaxID=637905 RepID=D4ZEU2_SHEVD|nr:alpha/beta hydrolase family protein [Shewanella violacea]BAJ00322.1 conserved hypothetical protein [Shewanella violacea DSS12]
MHFNPALVISLFFLLTAPAAIAADPQDASPTETITQENMTQDKAVFPGKYDYLPKEEIIEITLGERKTEVLVRPWSGKKKLGSAILLANLGMGADGAGFQAYLRRQLNPAGWATISLTPPNKVLTPNFATSPEEIAKAGEMKQAQKSTEMTEQYADDVWKKIREKQSQFLSQAIDQLDAIGAPYPGKRLLITSGQGAGLVITMLSNNLLAKPDILVIINPYMKMKDENLGLAKQLAELDIPVLDIQSADGHRASYKTARLRAELSPQNAPYRYSQQTLVLNLNNPMSWETALKLIEGFALRITNRAEP